MASLQTRYFGTQSLSLPTPIPVLPTFYGMLWEVEEAEDDFHQLWRFHYVVLFAAHRRSCLWMLAEDTVLAEDEKAGKSSENEESSSSDRTMDDSVVIGTVTADNPSVSSGRDVGLHAGDETGGRRGRISLLFEPGRIWVEYSPNLFPKREPNPKVVADTSSLFDVVSREGSELNKVLGELGICREKRLNSVVEKVQRALQKRAMAASGSAYVDVMEIHVCVVGTLSSSVRQPIMKKTVLPFEQIAHVQIPLEGTEGVVADRSVAWKSTAEVLKLAAANRGELVQQHDAEKAALQEQFEQEEGLSREDVDLALAGKYGEIVFPGDDVSPVAEQTPAPPVADDPTNEEVVHLRGKMIKMEKALSRARDFINRTQQDVEVENDKVKNMWFAKGDEGGGASTSKPRAEESEEEEVEDLLPHTRHKTRPQEVVIFNEHLQVDASSSRVEDKENDKLAALSASNKKLSTKLQQCSLAVERKTLLNSKLESEMLELQSRLNAVTVELSCKDAEILTVNNESKQ
ncbi:hypothetical protein GIB67_035719 [Kingdonia uniflora]|uniref:Uncharacterized protein n=1 Tax=Kingdonia uniflora TaxID=39325 RepID=A0A7J7M5E3_9MAGN|nr:hypothetical protein GIB67_035719 [Kingdonia uniflora]